MTGVFPIAPTPFKDSGALDLDGMRRIIDCMVDQGVDGICILANYSEQFLLSDAERDLLLDLCMEHNAGRVPIIVTCSHFSTRVASERAVRAAQAGAAVLMLMPPYHGTGLKADDEGVVEHYAAIAEAAGIPIMVQDAPLSGVNLSIPLLVRLARQIEQVSYFKIEMPGTAAKVRTLIEAGGDYILGPFDGEESITLMADLDAGATGTMDSALIPDLIKPVMTHYLAGRRDEAAAQYSLILPAINYENHQCGLRATKEAMVVGGVIRSAAVRHPLVPLHPATCAGMLELLQELDPIVLRWGH
jgi:2-keto-3-deoxy-L-arabinonate dehydratase